MLLRRRWRGVRDAAFDAESLKEDNEVSEVVDEVVVAFVGFDRA